MKTKTKKDHKPINTAWLVLGIVVLGGSDSHAVTVLIDYNDGVAGGSHDAAVRNGGFESGTDLTGPANFVDVEGWLNMRGLENAQASIDTFPKTGTRSAITSGDAALYAQSTDYTIQSGDQFSGSMDWRTALNSEANDVIRITLFYTADDTLLTTATTADATDFFTFTANNATALNVYETASWASTVIGAGNAAIGKTLMFRFESLGTSTPTPIEYGRVDNVYLQVIPEPGAALLGGLGMLALLRRRR